MSAELDQVGQLAFARRLQLAAALAQLRLDVGVAEPLVDLLLGLAELDLAALGLGDAVLGDREAAADRLFAQLHVVGLGAGEVLQQVAEGGGRRRSAGRPRRRCGSGRGRRWRPGLPAAAISGWPARCSASAAGSSAVAIRSMSLQVSAQRRTEPATSTRLAAGCSRSAAASSSAIGRTFESSRRPGPSPGSPSRSSEARMFSSAFGPRPLTSRICSASAAALRSSIEAMPSSSKRRRAVFGADAGHPGHLDQGRRELRLQLHRGRDLAGLQQRVDLFRQRLADAGDLGRPPCAASSATETGLSRIALAAVL